MVTEIVRTPARPIGAAPLVLDVDSTLWDLMRAIETLTGLPYEDLISDWNAILKYVSVEEARDLFRRSFDLEVMRTEGPLPGVQEAVSRLRDAGHRIVLMTDRPHDTAESLVIWLDQHDIHWDELRCGPGCKITAAGERGIRVIVDDKPSTLEFAHQSGMSALTIDVPYNAEVVRRLGLRSAPDWDGLTPHLEEVLAAVS